MYEPPVKDLLFVLGTQLNTAQLATSARYADYSDDLAAAVLGEAARFATGVLDPLNRSGDTEGARWTAAGVKAPAGYAEAYKQYVSDGWPLLGVSQTDGGQGAPLVLSTAAEEIWFGANVAFMLCPQLGRGAIEALLFAGSESLKARFLPKMISGEWSGTMDLTEPQAGSDLAAIRTRAQPEGDHFRIFGQKIFITWGDHDLSENIVHLVLARIDGAPAGVRGISLFVVPRTVPETGERNDLRCVSIEHKLGLHASPTCALAFGDGPGALGYLVGEAHHGLEYMFVMMNSARLSVGVQGTGLAERALQLALGWARTRVQGKPLLAPRAAPAAAAPTIIEHPDVRRMLLAMKSCTQAMRALGLYAALQQDLMRTLPAGAERDVHSARAELLTPITKGWLTEQVNVIASLGVQVHGGMGFVEETGAAQILRDARITSIYEGTTGIQANDLLGRKLLRDQGAALRALIAALQARLGAAKDDPPAAAAAAGAARAALVGLQLSGEALLAMATRALPEAYAVAVPFLLQAGFACGGALLSEAAQLAARALARGSSDAGFMQSKIDAANVFATHWLPQAEALAAVVAGGAAAVTGASAELI